MKKLFIILVASLVSLSALAQVDDEEFSLLFGSLSSGLAAPTPDIGWFKLNEGSGTAPANSVTGGSNAVTSATWVTGKSGSGSALSFNGTSSDGSVTNVAFNTNLITICSWLFFNVTNVQQCLWESNTNVNFGYRDFRLLLTSPGQLSCTLHGYGDGLNFRVETCTAPNTNAWVHIATVLDNSTTNGNVKFYFNGIIQTDAVGTDTKNMTGNWTTTNLFFGARSPMLVTRNFLNGKMDDIRIYSGELSASQIQAVANDPQ